MNLNAVYELKERLEAAAIAGTGLILEDFRLKRAVAQMEPLAGAVPVFGKINSMAKKLMEPGCSDPAGLLMEALALLKAVLCTQGMVQCEGELTQPESFGGSVVANAPYSLLAPVKNALTGTGGGRYNLLYDAHENHPEIFKDYRIQKAMVHALGDSYGELADMIKGWLIKEGDKSLLPFLKQGFEPAGKKDMMRRIEVMREIAGSEENEFYLSVLPSSKKDVKEALIHALALDRRNEALLLELASTEKGTARKHVLAALCCQDSAAAGAYIGALVRKKPEEFAVYLAYSEAGWASDLVAELLRKLLLHMLEPGVSELSEEEASLFSLLLTLGVGKTSPDMQEVVRLAAKNIKKLTQVWNKGKKLRYLNIRSGYTNKWRRESGVVWALDDMLAETVLFAENGAAELAGLVKELFDGYGEAYLGAIFSLALMTEDREAVYEQYHHALETSQNAVADVFGRMHYERENASYVLLHAPSVWAEGMENKWLRKTVPGGISLRWYDSIITYAKRNGKVRVVSQGNIWTSESKIMLKNLIIPENEELCRKIGSFWYNKVKASGGNSEDIRMLNMLGWKDYKGLLSSMVKHDKDMNVHQIILLLSDMPFTAEEYREELEPLVKGPLKGKNGIGLLERYLEELNAGVIPENWR